MSFKVSVEAPDLMKQIELLKYYPEIYQKHFYPAMQGAASDLGALIEPNVPILTGKARAAFKKRVTKNGFMIEGRVGWWGAGQPWYINVVEYGAKQHAIDSYAPGLAKFIGEHPGFAGRGFMKQGFEAGQDATNIRISAAAERVVKELAVP